MGNYHKDSTMIEIFSLNLLNRILAKGLPKTDYRR